MPQSQDARPLPTVSFDAVDQTSAITVTGKATVEWDLLYVSEIGLVVDDVAAAAAGIKEMAALAPYKGESAEFTAMGDEYGLVLVMKRGRVIDFTGNADHGVQVYRTGVNLRGAKAAKHQLAPHPYHLTIEERCSCA